MGFEICGYRKGPVGEVVEFKADDPKAKSRTQQHFKNEVNINNIIDKYRKTGILGDPFREGLRKPLFGDFSEVPGLLEGYIKVEKVKNYFNNLPSRVRNYFKNDLSRFLAFMSDNANIPKARELGIIEPDLSKVKYVDKAGVDKTAEVVAERGVKVEGRNVDPASVGVVPSGTPQ